MIFAIYGVQYNLTTHAQHVSDLDCYKTCVCDLDYYTVLTCEWPWPLYSISLLSTLIKRYKNSEIRLLKYSSGSQWRWYVIHRHIKLYWKNNNIISLSLTLKCTKCVVGKLHSILVYKIGNNNLSKHHLRFNKNKPKQSPT